jgi:hypothetical protein
MTKNTHKALSTIREAAQSDIKGLSLRSKALGYMSEMDLVGIPQTDIIPQGDFTDWLRGDKTDLDGWINQLGANWNELDTDIDLNRSMRQVTMEVATVLAYAKKVNAFCDKNGKRSDHAQVIQTPKKGEAKNPNAGKFYVINATIPGHDPDQPTAKLVSFSEAYVAARKTQAKPSETGKATQPEKLFQAVIALCDSDGLYDMATLSPEAIELLPQVSDAIEEYMEQKQERDASSNRETDVSAVAM